MSDETVLVEEELLSSEESHDEPAIVDELIIEEVSIDGMCGVY